MKVIKEWFHLVVLLAVGSSILFVFARPVESRATEKVEVERTEIAVPKTPQPTPFIAEEKEATPIAEAVTPEARQEATSINESPSIVDVSGQVACAERQTAQMQSYQGITVHHTAHAKGERVGPYHLVQAKVNVGWDHAPYHFLIANGDGTMSGEEAFTDGTIWQLQDLAWCSEHAALDEQDCNLIAVSIDDNLSIRTLKPGAYQSLLSLLRWLCVQYDILPENIKGHRELKDNSTECPGNNVDLDAIRAEVAQALQAMANGGEVRHRTAPAEPEYKSTSDREAGNACGNGCIWSRLCAKRKGIQGTICVRAGSNCVSCKPKYQAVSDKANPSVEPASGNPGKSGATAYLNLGALNSCDADNVKQALGQAEGSITIDGPWSFNTWSADERQYQSCGGIVGRGLCDLATVFNRAAEQAGFDTDFAPHTTENRSYAAPGYTAQETVLIWWGSHDLIIEGQATLHWKLQDDELTVWVEEPIIGLWVDTFNTPLQTRYDVDLLVDFANEEEVNLLVVEVRKRGIAYYSGSPEPMAVTGFDPLAYLLEKTDAVGIAVHAWLDAGWRNASTHLDFTNQIDQDYLKSLVHPLLNYKSLEGVHLDWIRYDASVEITDDHREDLASLVAEISDMCHQKGKELSVATVTWNPSPQMVGGFAETRPYLDVGQDWESWVEDGIVDILMPMNYFSDLQLYRDWLEYETNLCLNTNLELVVGIPDHMGVDVDEYKRLALEAGAAGVIYYSYNSLRSR